MHLPLGADGSQTKSGTLICSCPLYQTYSLSAVFHFVSTFLRTLSTTLKHHTTRPICRSPSSPHRETIILNIDATCPLPSSLLAPVLDILDILIAATTCPSACPIYQYLASPVLVYQYLASPVLYTSTWLLSACPVYQHFRYCAYCAVTARRATVTVTVIVIAIVIAIVIEDRSWSRPSYSIPLP